MPNKICIIDYGMGNLRSVEKKLHKLGAEVVISDNQETIDNSDKLVLPGVGHFKNGIDNLKRLDLLDLLNERVLNQKVPVLGICLGMQLFAKRSEEGNIGGLNWIDAEIIRFNVNDKIRYKVPHMGWNNITVKKDTKLFKGVDSKDLFYFVHSYHYKMCTKEFVLGTSNYSYEFVSAVEKENIFGTQFHPEKSQDSGEKILTNFINL